MSVVGSRSLRAWLVPTERIAPPDDWPTLGLEVALWCEEYLRWDAGEFAGQPVQLNSEQIRFFADCYRVYPQGHAREGQRVVRRAVKSRPKGAGKSAEAKLLCVAEGMGPVQFDGWDAAGQPVGRPRSAPFIRVMATEEQQSITTVFGGVVEMLRLAQDLFPDEFGGVDAGMTRVYLPGGGQMRPSTASAASKDGGRETLAIVDEGHLHTSPELIEAYRTVRRNLAKRPGSWLLECSTMFAPGEGSIMEQSWEYSRKQLDQHDDMTFLWDHREGREVADFNDDEELRGSLMESYGAAAKVVPLDEIMAEVRDPTCEPAEAMRYFLNLRVAGDGRCVDPVVWNGCSDPLRLVEGPIAVGFDGSLMRANGDATVLVGCTLAEPRHLFVLGAWEQPEEECWDEVEACVEDAFAEFDVALFYADRARWGPRIDGWYAKWPKAMKTWPATSMRRVGQGFADMQSGLVTGRISHDGDELLTRHVGNAVRRYTNAKDSDGNRMWIGSKDTHGSTRRIDAYYAAMLAHTAALEAVASGYKGKRRARLVTF